MNYVRGLEAARGDSDCMTMLVRMLSERSGEEKLEGEACLPQRGRDRTVIQNLLPYDLVRSGLEV